ncbi:phospholipid-transporting ATPase ABCA1-like isoform X2 [Lycorma delicatula]|uniref:phospholipid-transporting ATPase ABCA1-like isoform X2 n=1 Tax=Lycorma delicatula TaxID=130591 RepID=UPI003F51093E
MSFFLQLRMLLWKNLRLRKRQKFRCVVEVVWPIFLFLILMWVRTRGLRVDMHECHFVQKAMPTAGVLPFIQSFLCTFNNTCHKFEKNAELKNSVNTSLLLNLFKDIKNFSQSSNMSRIQSTISDIRELSSLIESFNNRRSYVNGGFKLPELVKNPSRIKEEVKRRKLPLSSNSIDALLTSELALNKLNREFTSLYHDNVSLLLCNKTLMQNLIPNVNPDDPLYSELCKMNKKDFNNLIASGIKEVDSSQIIKEIGSTYRSLSWQEVVDFVTLTNNINSDLKKFRAYSDVISDFVELNGSYRNISAEVKERNAPWYEEIITILDALLCGQNLTSNKDDDNEAYQPGQSTTSFDSLNDQLKDRGELKYEYDVSASPYCNGIFKIFEESPFLKTIWRIYKPFVRGKILYTPKTLATERIMKNMNTTFSWIEDAKHLLNNTLMYFSIANDVLLDNAVAVETIKKFVQSTEGQKLINNSLIADVFKTNSEINTGEIQEAVVKYMDDDNENKRAVRMANLLDIVHNISGFLECFDLDKIHSYPTEQDAVEAGMELLESNTLLAVIVFEDQVNDTLSPYVTYKIRMNSERVDNTQFIHDASRMPGPRMRPLIDLKYITFGFAYLQDLLEHYIIIEQTGLNSSELPGIYLQQFPYPCYIDDQFVMAISRTFPLFMVLSWVYTCAMIVKSIVYEKEQRLKETMHVMGLGNGIHWVGWFIDSLIPMLLTIFLLTVILTYGSILRNAEPTLIYCFMTVYCIATISQSFLISVFFSRANIAAASGGLIFFVLYLPYPFMVRWMLFLSPTVKAFMCLSSNVAFGLGASYFSLYEERGTGLHWEDVYESPLYNDEFSLYYVMLLLGVDSVIYMLLTWYIEAVAPGQYGVPKPWYFPLNISYWTGTQRKKVEKGIIERTGSASNENCEGDPTSLKIGISIHNLTKVYPNGKVAVRDLSINFYEDQITSFLGHNGAGKTTTISILTGLFAPTSGTAYINGLDIRSDMDIIRNSLGMCPQHNVLFDQLTVEEHLLFYSRLRGKQNFSDVIAEIDQMINDLQLPHKRTSLAKDLSGGMKRKLSIAVAFIGGSKTVILDEPTSGVDPYSRRSIWELLMKYKKGRTVVLTTHYMDEADLLGDRIAIVANGQLQCCGSSLFLKNRFGSGYYLTIDMNRNGGSLSTESQDFHEVHNHIQGIVPSAQFLEQIGTELVYILPQRDKIEEFRYLFVSLDKNKTSLNIASYGISDTSLEEIFLRVAERADPAITAADGNSEVLKDKSCFDKIKCYFKIGKTIDRRTALVNDIQVGEVEPEIDDNVVQLNGSIVKYSSVPISDEGEHIIPEGNKNWRQYLALHVKRFHHTRRKKKALFSELVLPALFVFLTLVVTSILPRLEGRPPLVLKPSMYGNPRFMFSTIENREEEWAHQYYSSLTGPVGLGMICTNNYSTYDENDDPDELCYEKSYYKPGTVNVSKFGPDCSCASGAQICPSGTGLPTPPKTTLTSREIVHDLSGSNVSDWILKTWKLHERNRMGGYNFGYLAPVPDLSYSDLVRLVLMKETSPEEFQNKTLYKKNNIKIWYNNKGWASSVSYLNAVNNVVLRSSLQSDKAADADLYGIRAINHPMNFTKKQLNIELIKQSGISLLHAISVLFALSFVPASFTLYLIEDRVTNSKHLQLVSGINRVIYWVQAYSWDMCCYLASATLCVFIFVVFNEQAYISSRNFLAFVCLLVLYGFSCIPLMYPASFVFKVPSSSFVSLACANMFIGIITTLTTFVLSIFEDEELKAVDVILKEIFLVFPHFCLGDGLMKLATNHLTYFSLKSFDIEIKNEIFKWEMTGKNLFCMFVSGILFFIITLIIEFQSTISSPFCCKRLQTIDSDEYNEDNDVKNERQRILLGDTTHDILIIDNLTKIYSRVAGMRPAVNKVCFGIKKGECFGLLGLNGAGKTTTFKMLTGAVKPTSGDSYVSGHSITREVENVRSLIGYCPQFDALDAQLTPREHLEFYARLRNIPSRQLQSTVDKCLKKLGLGHYSDRSAGTLSGGNKRKLSTAIAILGNPPLIFLDEPTSGMDPRARRFLWSCIQQLVREGHSVILTSHSMEECQALCTRLTIMVNGEFKCLGSSQHLKNKFGGGYSLAVHCPEGENTVQSVKEFVSLKLDKMILQEEHHTRLRYQLPPSTHSLPDVFSVMESAREKSLILDYSLSQTTLEDVFLQFAMEQSEGVQVKNKHRLKPAFLHQCARCCLVRKSLKIIRRYFTYSFLHFKRRFSYQLHHNHLLHRRTKRM